VSEVYGSFVVSVSPMRIAAAHVLVFAAWLFGVDVRATSRCVAGFIARGVRIKAEA
jgi:hypothetical protein